MLHFLRSTIIAYHTKFQNLESLIS